MPREELGSAVPGLVASTSLHPGRDFLVWICHIRRRDGHNSSILSSASGVEVAAHPLQKDQCSTGLLAGFTFHCSWDHQDGDNIILYLR